ncbi:site-specific integrase [Marinobacter salinisoli]|uniref:Site-specific integrase n=1 Tax=Marinobacter salinisoli TaxID=2769486 RepID=A0ABX7MR86_9GAMM|nr:site-specific integrase [Marinobacter salinisoli]QSP94022.1 site-specific integrase [Marinobacter salinisoli]
MRPSGGTIRWNNMYLQRSSFGVYYTRIPLPKCARDDGFPHAVRVSLLTKCRKTAVQRNALVSGCVLDYLGQPGTFSSRDHFDRDLKALRLGLHGFFDGTLNHPPAQANAPETPLVSTSTETLEPKSDKKAAYRDFAWLIRSYMKYKRKTGVTEKYLQQVAGRLRPLVGYFNDRNPRTLKMTDALGYQEDLVSNDWSAKTTKEYMSVARQLCDWCVRMDYLRRNPFDGVKAILQESKAAHEQRAIWTPAQLQDLLSHERFSTRGGPDDMWIPLILLHSGLRPSEACQLRVSDVRQCPLSGIWYFNVSDEGPGQRVKTANARRHVPVHHDLLQRGFLEYLSRRKAARKVQLFNCTPTGKDNDWSRNFTQRFNRFLSNKLGYETGNRPTAHSLRHTFIDALKQQDVPEYLVAEIAGHSKRSITFGRYGKPSGLAKCAKVINSIELVGGR